MEPSSKLLHGLEETTRHGEIHLWLEMIWQSNIVLTHHRTLCTLNDVMNNTNHVKSTLKINSDLLQKDNKGLLSVKSYYGAPSLRIHHM